MTRRFPPGLALSSTLAVALTGVAVGVPDPARADEPAHATETAGPPRPVPHSQPVGSVRADDAPPSPLARPHTVATFEAGILALPSAPISASQRGGDTPFGAFGTGDATIQTSVHLLFRASPEWAIGAGVLFAPQPTSDDQYGGLTGLRRTHSRNYLVIGANGAYFPLRSRWVEAHIGVGAGGVIVADRFTTDAGDAVPIILGQKEVTLRSEGLATSAQIGVDWMFSDRWVAGFAAGGGLWFLPGTARCSVIGDCTTLLGVVETVQLGLTIGYRIPL